MARGRTAELHCFADASMTGMAAVCYVRQQQEGGDWTLTFLVGKARVSPAVTPTTVARLELNAPVLAEKLVDTAVRELEWTGSVYLHSDAQAVLKYIKASEQRFPVYVANRARQIRELTVPSNWNYVRTEDNPADEGSRGVEPGRFTANNKWLRGLERLRGPGEAWDVMREVGREEEEREDQVLVMVSGAREEQTKKEEVLDRISSWEKLVRVVAIVQRMISTWVWRIERREGKSTCAPGGQLSAGELEEGGRMAVIWEQKGNFDKEYRNLEKGQLVQRQSQLRNLDPVLLAGAIRVGGRLKRAALDESEKHPIILPKKANVTGLLIMKEHTTQGHLGVMQTLASLRRTFWPIGGAATVRRYITGCYVCRRMRGPAGSQKMAYLPE